AYQWIVQSNWTDPDAICCRCRIHENEMPEDSFAEFNGRFRSGWPVITAGPVYPTVTPGSDIKFEVKIATNTLLPVSYQWRREQLYFVTNVTFVLDPDNPNGGYWVTNRQGRFAVTNLTGETNAIYQIKNAQTNHSDYYSVAISNSMGT